MEDDDWECSECEFQGEPESGDQGGDGDAAGVVQCPECGALDWGD